MKFSITGFDKVRSVIAGWTNRLRDLGPAYNRAAVVVLSSAQMRIRTKNNGTWAPEAEPPKGSSPNQQGTLLFRTGALMRSLTVGGSGNLIQDLGNGVRVGTNLRTPDGQYSIGVLQQFGTRPTDKFVCFEINGQKIFSKGTKGIPARPFLFIDEDDAQRVTDVFSTYLAKGDA